MFAAIAEVSGTVVLPLVDATVQAVYVWFLMVFPCFLVLLFFVTLWIDHSVLYAPSDYKDEAGFVTLFNRGVPKYSVISPGTDVDDVDSGASESEAIASVENVLFSPIEKTPDDTPAPISEAEVEETKAVTKDLEREFYERYRKNAQYMQDVATVMGTRYRAECTINASPKSMPNVTFDFVLNAHDVNCVGKTIFVTAANHPTYVRSLVAWLDLVSLFFSGLSSAESEKFSCLIVVVYRNLPSRHLSSLREVVMTKAQELPFKVDFEPFRSDELIAQAQRALDASNH